MSGPDARAAEQRLAELTEQRERLLDQLSAIQQEKRSIERRLCKSNPRALLAALENVERLGAARPRPQLVQDNDRPPGEIDRA